MDDAAQVFAHAEGVRKPRVRELERKAGDDEDDEAGKEHEVLPALIHRHARHKRILHAAARHGFAAPDDGIVQEHHANN